MQQDGGPGHTASRALSRIEPVKANEETRHLDAFLRRLGVKLKPNDIQKSERPDFFMMFHSATGPFVVGCEIVRFQTRSEGASQIGYAHHWKRFAERLSAVLISGGIRVYGVVHLCGDTKVSLERLLKKPDRAIDEIHARLKSTEVGASIVRFDPSAEPVLASTVERIDTHERERAC